MMMIKELFLTNYQAIQLDIEPEYGIINYMLMNV